MGVHSRYLRIGAVAGAVFVVSCAPPPPPPRPPADPAPSKGVVVEEAPKIVHPDPGRIIPVTEDEPSFGDPLAPVTWVIWGDFECQFTAKLFMRLNGLLTRYGPKNVRVVWRNDPLSFHESAYPIAVTAHALFRAGGSRAFWAFAQRVFANQDSISPENLARWSAETGVSYADFAAAMDDPATAAKIQTDIDLGKKVGVTGTPASFINGTFLQGAHADEKFDALLAVELAKAHVLQQGGVAPESVYAAAVEKNFVPPKPYVAPPQDTTTVWKVPVDKSPLRGNKNALVTLVMFGDFQCIFCEKAQPTLEKLATHYGDKLRFVFKNNPLDFHPRAKPAATFAMEARKQGGDAKFWEAYKLLYENRTRLGDADLIAFGEKLGLRAGSVKTALEKALYKKDIEADMDLAEDLVARGTPHFFINGRRLVGAQPFASFQSIIDEEIVHAEKLLADKTPLAKLYDALQKDAKGPPPPVRILVPAPTDASPAKGAKPGPGVVTVQIFSDYQCQYCKRLWANVDPLIADFPNKVRVVYRELPLTTLHADAELAAEAAREAFAQKGSGGYFNFAGLLFETQATNGLTKTGLLASAKVLGLDVDKMRAALDGGTRAAEVKVDRDLATQLHIAGTPALAVGDFFIGGAQPLRVLERAVNRALAKPKPPKPEELYGHAQADDKAKDGAKAPTNNDKDKAPSGTSPSTDKDGGTTPNFL